MPPEGSVELRQGQDWVSAVYVGGGRIRSCPRLDSFDQYHVILLPDLQMPIDDVRQRIQYPIAGPRHRDGQVLAAPVPGDARPDLMDDPLVRYRGEAAGQRVVADPLKDRFVVGLLLQ